MSLLVSLVIARVRNVFHINVIVIGQNIFQVWNMPRQPLLECVSKQKFKSQYASNASFYWKVVKIVSTPNLSLPPAAGSFALRQTSY